MNKKLLLWLLFLFPIQVFAVESFCTMDAMQCSDWSWVWRSWPNCEFQCPTEKLTPALCSTNYDPVCAQPPMPVCPEGMMCAQVMPSPKTYSNSCLANIDKAEILYNWECKSNITDDVDNVFDWCKSWYDGCNTCSVVDWKLTACTEMACFTQGTSYCKEYELTKDMEQLLKELNWEVMFLWWSKYFDESKWENNIELIEDDITLYNKMLKVSSIDSLTKEKIKNEINKLNQFINTSNPDNTKSEDQLKCEWHWWNYFVFQNSIIAPVGLCKFANWKVCESQKYNNWNCLKLFTLTENRQINSVHNAFETVIENRWWNGNNKLIAMLRVWEKINNLKNKLTNLKQLWLVFNAIDNWYNKYLIQVIKNWSQDNIDLLNLEEPVLWWNWYIVEVKLLENSRYELMFEDGHIQQIINIEFEIVNNELIFKIID